MPCVANGTRVQYRIQSKASGSIVWNSLLAMVLPRDAGFETPPEVSYSITPNIGGSSNAAVSVSIFASM
jgi:hypothetical protein